MNNHSFLQRTLRRRGTHRLLGSPALGTLSAFLTGLVIIRLGANLFLLADLHGRGTPVDWLQAARSHFVFLGALLLWAAPLSAFRTGSALPVPCFIDTAFRGRKFRSFFLMQSGFLQPQTLIAAGLLILTAVTAQLPAGFHPGITGSALLTLCLSVGGFILTLRLLQRLQPPRFETEILQALYLITLALSNPDIGSRRGSISILYRGVYHLFSSPEELPLALIIFTAAALGIPLVFKILSRLGDRRNAAVFRDPLLCWYVRFFRLRTWLILYGILGALFMSPFVSPEVKGWALFLSILFGIVSFLAFLSHCDNTLYEKWGQRLMDREHRRIPAKALGAHILGMAIPAAGYIAAVYIG